MKHLNCWTLGVLSAGLVSLPGIAMAEEVAQPVLTQLSATTLSGYVDTSAQWNLGTGNANVPAYAYGGPSKADGFNLNAAKISLQKPVNSAESWGAGYQVDLFMGPDADAFANQSTSIAADFAVRQAYVALHAPIGNGLDFQIGVWDPIMGYEVTDAPADSNFTRSYGYTIEPVSHTGVKATYAFSEAISATVGIANTFGPTINGRAFLNGATTVPSTGQGPKAESYKAYMAAVTFTAPTNCGVLAGSTLTASVMNGFNSASPGAGFSAADQTSWYVGGTFNTPVTGLKVGASYDYAGVSAQPLTEGLDRRSGYANAVGLYVSYQLTEKLGLYARGEYASSNFRDVLLARDVFETTGTLQYDLWKNVLSRVEFRWDHAADDSHPFGGTAAGPGTKDNSYILLADFAYKF
jgi:hypothetical protein